MNIIYMSMSMLLFVIVLLAKFPKIIFVFQLGREKKIDITMLKLLKILHITQNENDSEVDKIILAHAKACGPLFCLYQNILCCACASRMDNQYYQ